MTGRNIANPTAFIRAAIDMLCYLGLTTYADLLFDALYESLTVQRIHTADIGGKNTSSEVIDTMIDNIRRATGNNTTRISNL